MHKVLFIASLANGETAAEETGNFQRIEGAPSPWQRLLSYVADKDTCITSLALYTKDGKRFNLPSGGKNPKFHALMTAEQPVDFNFFRKAATDVIGSGITDLYAVAEAIFENGARLQIWVNERNPDVSWSFFLQGEAKN